MEWYELLEEIPSRGQSSEELVGLILVLRPSSLGSWLEVVRWRGRREFIILEDVEARRSKEDAVVLLLLLSFGAIFIFVEV
mmetsp:Transcript_36861/g.54212  ORF Transcript_36861/g.54212 Transcript_36861/m.54212 type:complete len:81 (+) Transcript_36861:1560-1802(+)